ncbi:MAG: hypothetical protein K0S47_3550 [Herbinix sp.]|nr:hypothetical protein [Herbinix sp.]
MSPRIKYPANYESTKNAEEAAEMALWIWDRKEKPVR